MTPVKVPWATASGFLLGEKGGALCWQAQAGNKLEVMDDANRSLRDGPQASCSHKERGWQRGPALRQGSTAHW